MMVCAFTRGLKRLTLVMVILDVSNSPSGDRPANNAKTSTQQPALDSGVLGIVDSERSI
jgi:hypothetical protein